MQIKRNDGPGSPDKPRVYVNSIFEIQENATVLPSNKVRRGLPVLLFRSDTDRVADPHHLDADPDPAFHFHADPDPDFHFYADPDPAHHQMDENLRPLVYRPYRAPFLSLAVSIVSLSAVSGPPKLFLSL
jgi:hypothetical protein